jgi:NAD-dependent dihydropyrimidine dehydrogenase PreA subunit
MRQKTNDEFLESRIAKYDGWLKNELISFSSRVVPIAESVDAEQCVLPSERVLEILSKAVTIALQKCECREHYKRCSRPLEVCFTLDEIGDRYIKKGIARRVSLEEAGFVLKQANESGLIHLSLYRPDHRIFALCSCCPCCCHDLQILMQYDRKDLVVRSEAVAVTDPSRCKECGTCVERCYFEARTFEGETMKYQPNNCYGCGLCVTACPEEAISLQSLFP